MSRYIDATKLQGEMMDMVASGLYGLEDMIDAVIEQPTVDAVPVVRCKDCVNWDEEYSSGRKSLGNYRCGCHEWSDEKDGFFRYTAEDDYCSYGERKETDKGDK